MALSSINLDELYLIFTNRFSPYFVYLFPFLFSLWSYSIKPLCIQSLYFGNIWISLLSYIWLMSPNLLEEQSNTVFNSGRKDDFNSFLLFVFLLGPQWRMCPTGFASLEIRPSLYGLCSTPWQWKTLWGKLLIPWGSSLALLFFSCLCFFGPWNSHPVTLLHFQSFYPNIVTAPEVALSSFFHCIHTHPFTLYI